MAKESDRDQDRVEEAFTNLSSKPGRNEASERARVWKVATLMLLLVALALPMAFGIRESRRAEEQAARLAAAREEAAAGVELVEEGDLGRALLALDRAIGRMADVPGTTRIAGEVRAKLQQNRMDIERLREDRSRRRVITAAQRKALDALLEGDTDAAATLLPAAAQTDPVSRSLLVLVRRLARWSLAAGEASGRASALDGLAKDWTLPALLADRDRAREEEMASYRVREKVREAYAALSAEDYAGARRAVWSAFEIRGLGGAEELLQNLGREELRARARELDEAGDLAGAEACYRRLADAHADAEARKRAAELEAGRSTLACEAALRKLWTDSVAKGDDLRSAVLGAVLRERSERGAADHRDSEHWLRWLTGRAYEDYREQDLASARAWVKEAADGGHEPAKELLATVEAELATGKKNAALRAAEDVLTSGAAAYARDLLRRAGPATAKELAGRIAAVERREAIERAAERIFIGDGGGALGILERAGLLKDERAAAYVVRARFLQGDIQAGLDLLPGAPEVQVHELLRAAALLGPQDAKGLAALVARALEIGGPRPDLQAALAMTLGDGKQQAEAKKLWAAVRDVALERAPLPKEKAPAPDEPPPDKEQPSPGEK